MKRPLVHVGPAFAAGIVLARSFSLPVALVVCLLAVMLAMLLAQARWRLPGRQVAPLVTAVVAAALLGAVRYAWEHDGRFRHLDEVYQASRWGAASISGTVDSVPAVRDGWLRMILRDLEVDAGSRVYALEVKALATVRVDPKAGTAAQAGDLGDVGPGDRIRFPGRLEEIREAGLPGAFDFQEWMAAQGVYARVQVWDPGVMVVQRGRPGMADRFRVWCAELRQRMTETVEKLPEPEGALLRAMLLGERRALPAELWRGMQRSGLAHLTTVSGLHFSILMAAFGGFLKVLGVRRKWAAILTVPFMLLLLGVVGYGPATVRAAIMGLVLMGGLLLQRRADSLNDLALAMLMLLLMSPMNLFRVGFQLSFLAVAGILLVTEQVRGWLGESPGLKGHWLIVAAASCGAVLGVGPAVAYYFGLVTPAAPVANLLAIPLATVALWLGAVGAILGLVSGTLAVPVMAVDERILGLLAKVAMAFAELPGTWWALPRPSLWWVAGAYLILLFLLAPGRVFPIGWRRVSVRRHQAILGVAAAMLWAGGLMPSRGDLAVTFLSVGQGDATLLEFPGGGTMLVDGGPPESAAGLVAFLRSLGLRRVDIVVVTHPEVDHLGGIPMVLEGFDVGLVVDPGLEGEGGSYAAYRRLIGERKIPYRVGEAGERIAGCGDVEITVLHPPRGSGRAVGAGRSTVSDRNDYSLVLYVRYGRVVFLLPGDIGSEAEQALCRRYDDLDTTVVKVPHHGSRYASSDLFLAVTDPEVAVIEVGPNPYGHPSSATIARYGEYGAMVFRTDRDGWVRVVTDGERYRIEAGKRREVLAGAVTSGTGE